MNTDNIKITGSVSIEAFDEFSNIFARRHIDNLVVTAGKDFLASWIGAASQSNPFMEYMQLGTLGTTTTESLAVGATSVTVATNILGSATTGQIVLNPGPNTASPNSDTETVSVTTVSGSTYTISATTYAHASGENVVLSPEVADTVLGTALGTAATVGVISTSANTWTLTTTFTDVGANITEAGIFSASTGSGTASMFAHVTYQAINLSATDGVTFKWTITFS
jgi:hypothetical protein